VLSVVLGLFLLVTAGLKIHGVYTDPYSQESILLTPRLLVALIEIEIVLGLWLLSGLAPRAAWLASLVFFTLGAAANLYMAFEGQRSCGCFGRVEVSPWLSLTLDVAAVAALLTLRPARGEQLRAAPWLQGLLRTAGGAVVFLVLIGGALLLCCDDPQRVLAQLRGELRTVEPPVTDVGEGRPGEQRTFTIQLANRTPAPVRILGGTSSCACVATDDLPLTLNAGETRSMTVQIRFRGSPGRFQQRFVLYTDSDEKRWVTARFAGLVLPQSAP
jgi:hypothetical protein